MADATCAGCGCACDDIEATVVDGRLSVTRTCALGDAWFAERGAAPSASIGGRRGEHRGGGRRRGHDSPAGPAPLVYGLGQASIEAQRQAVALAGAIGAIVDPGGGAASGLAFQALGSSTATFGEIRDRGGLVVVWRADPAVTNPRLLGRLQLDRAARGSRPLVVVDAQAGATAEEADAFVELDAAQDFEALWALRALVGNAPLDRDRAATSRSTRSASSLSACSAPITSPSCMARSTSSERSRCSRSCAISATIATRSRWRCAARATRAAPRTCLPGRPASPRR